MKLTLQSVKGNPKIEGFISQTEKYLDALGYTDHGHRHINIVADRVKKLSQKIGLSQHDTELASIAGYCHDMGNFLGRTEHHYWAAMLFSQIFINEADDSKDISEVMQAIVGHDKDHLKMINKITAVLILADKSDVHRTRVKMKKRKIKDLEQDIHDRVNYAVTDNKFLVNSIKKEITLKMKVDTQMTTPLEYFEIFTERMTYCRQAADYLGYKFILIINNFKLS